jgi:alanine racemase
VEFNKSFAEIDLRALSHNLRIARSATKNKEIMAVVKADAYGHGAVRISRHLLNNEVSMLGVAFLKEAVDLREAGITAPILIFFDTSNIETCLKYNITPTVFDLNTARKFSTAASRLNIMTPVHIKVDTGMGRVGLDMKNALDTITRIAGLDNINTEGLMSHFPDAEIEDKSFARLQLKNFRQLIKSLRAKKINFRYLHMANSAAVLTMPEASFNMVRPGIMLYGYGPTDNNSLKPVLSLKSTILFLKKVPAGTSISYGRTFITKRNSRIATVPVGYADGYSRRLSNQGKVIINGMLAPVVGRVCMDTIMVDVTEIKGVRTGAEVVLIGRQGRQKISARDIAEKTGTIPYEVLTSIGQRVKRVYK